MAADDDEIRELAALLKSGSPVLGIRRATVTAFNRSNNSYTVTLGGGPVPGVLALQHVTADIGEIVDVMFDGDAPLIVGVIGAAKGLPDTTSYTTASSQAAQTPTANIWTRLTLAFEDGNSGNFSDANDWYTVPSTGLYLVEGRARVADGSTAGVNVGLNVSVADDDNANDVWNSVPTTGAARRMVLENVRVARYTAGQQIRLAVYLDGGTVTMSRRRLSVIRLGG